MPRVMPKTPNRERLETRGRPVGVDREAKVIRGYVVAMAGPFKSEGRGEFDETALSMIVDLYKQLPNGAGLKSRFTHPSESNDGLGKFLGRSRGAFLSTCVNADGKDVPCVRADLHLDPSAFATPEGNLGDYILTLAESDAEALSSSLVLSTTKQIRRNDDGTELTGEDGKPLPPLWRPLKLFASDVVDTGDAVDGFLSATATDKPRWTRDYLNQGESLLNTLFAGQTRETVEARCAGFLSRYLDRRYGRKAKKMSAAKLDEYDPVPCPKCDGTGDCQKCGGSGIDPAASDTSRDPDCTLCDGTGLCNVCNGTGELKGDQGDDLAAGTVEERDDGFYAVFADGSEEGPFETREEAEAAIAAKEMPADEGAAARPSVDLLRRRLTLKRKAG